MSKPRGVTDQQIARWFQSGWSIDAIADWYKCSVRDIEKAIRKYVRPGGSVK